MKNIKQESIIVLVVTLIVIFVSAFIIVYSLNFYVEKVTSEYDKEISNSRARLSLTEILSNKLFIIEDCNIKISNTDNNSIVNFCAKKIFQSLDDFEKILKILQNGGAYNKIASVTIVGKSQIKEKIVYYRVDDTYNIEVIELSSKIVEIKKISNFIIDNVRDKLNDERSQSIENVEYEINILLKQIETYFRRSHESLNITIYDNTVKINELSAKIDDSKKELNFFRYIIYLITFFLASILTRVILKRIGKLLNEKQEYLNKIEKSRKTIQDIFDAMPVGVILVDKKRKISKVNKTALTLIDTENYNDILCAGCKSIFSVNQEKSCPYDDNVSLDEVEIDLVTSKGEIIPVIKNVIPITINDEDFLLEAFMDISKQKEVESQLKIAVNRAEESDQLKTEFIHNMSHEIRTPLNGIVGFSELLNNPKLTAKELKEHINIIKASGDQLTHIIDDILEIAALETNQTEIVEVQIVLNELLQELFSLFNIKAKERDLTLYLKNGLSDKNSSLLADEVKLKRILFSLIENAIKFTIEGTISIGYKFNNETIEIYVKDTGIGIKPECHATIFNRFSQEEKELSKNVGGLGLGLSIAKENAKLMGGDVTVQSIKGEGSTFILTIPYKPVDIDSVKSKSVKKKDRVTKKQGKYTILIAEDEIINYKVLSMILKNLNTNLTILHAINGKEAVDICRETPEINMVLMDLKMPIMSGFEATTLIKGLRPGLPIIAQTAYSTEKDKQKAFSAGCDDFISKPINKDILKDALDNYLV